MQAHTHLISFLFVAELKIQRHFLRFLSKPCLEDCKSKLVNFKYIFCF